MFSEPLQRNDANKDRDQAEDQTDKKECVDTDGDCWGCKCKGRNLTVSGVLVAGRGFEVCGNAGQQLNCCTGWILLKAFVGFNHKSSDNAEKRPA